MYVSLCFQLVPSTFVPMSVCKCSRGFLFKILQPVLWICQCYSCLNAVWQNTAQLTRSWLKPEMFCMQWRPLCWFLSLLKVIPCCRRALKPMRKTWRYHLPSSAARTWCAACAWRWCLRRSTLASAALASSPTATTATVWSAFASGGVPSSLRAKSSSKCFSLLWTKWKWHCGCGVRVCRTSELVVWSGWTVPAFVKASLAAFLLYLSAQSIYTTCLVHSFILARMGAWGFLTAARDQTEMSCSTSWATASSHTRVSTL